MTEDNINPTTSEGQAPPPLQTSEELMLEEIKPYLLDPREDYPEPYYMLEFNGVPFSTIGGLQAISGQKKNGKSFVLTQLMAVCLASGSARVSQYLPGLAVPQRTIDKLGHLPRVLYVDTEMEKLNTAKVLRRVHWLCEWDMKEPQDRFFVMWMREVKGSDNEAAYRRRYRLIKYGIELLKPDIVFIDGVRDIIGDFNNNLESAELVQDLMSLASSNQLCIWLALHMNPRPGNDDESKMRGHLGTELGNKVTDTLVSSKSKQGSEVTFTVRQVDARGKDMDDWKFQVVDDAGKLGVPKIVAGGSVQRPVEIQNDPPEDIKQWIDEAKEMYEWPMSRADIKKKVFGKIGGQMNDGKQQADLIAAINLGYFQETTIKKKGYPMLMVAEDLPF